MTPINWDVRLEHVIEGGRIASEKYPAISTELKSDFINAYCKVQSGETHNFVTCNGIPIIRSNKLLVL